MEAFWTKRKTRVWEDGNGNSLAASILASSKAVKLNDQGLKGRKQKMWGKVIHEERMKTVKLLEIAICWIRFFRFRRLYTQLKCTNLIWSFCRRWLFTRYINNQLFIDRQLKYPDFTTLARFWVALSYISNQLFIDRQLNNIILSS